MMANIHWMSIVLAVLAGACTKSKFKGDQQDATVEQPQQTGQPPVNNNPAAPNNPSEDGLASQNNPNPNNPNTINNGNQTAQAGIGNNSGNANEILGQLAEEIINLTGGGPNNVPGGGGETPLTLDWNRDGKVSTSSEALVNRLLFDVDGDGTLDFIEWVSPAEALLSLDTDQNGRIDSGRELFGTAMPKRSDKFARSSNGFAALADYDENHDQVIDSKDGIFARLMVWVDANQNAISEPSELKSLKDTDVASISLKYRNLAGNERKLAAPSRSTVGQVATYQTKSNQEFKIVDLYFHVYEYGRQTSLSMLKGGK